MRSSAPARWPDSAHGGRRGVGWRPTLAGVLLPVWLLVAASVQAAEPTRQDNRSVTVESTLKDLSRANDAEIARQGLTAVPGRDGTGQPRTELVQPPQPDAAEAVSGAVQSSLHRLKRDTVIRQTPDGRKVLIEDSRDRASEEAEPGRR